MIGGFVHGETIQIVRWLRDERNAHGQLRPVFSDPEDVHGVGVEVPSAIEPRDGIANRQIADLVIFLPPRMTVTKRDTITVRGEDYEVEGDTAPTINFFTGSTFPTEVNLKRVTG